MFPTIDKNSGFPERELAVGAFWKEHGIYEKTLAAREGAPPFVFYEGPPTANGLPHPGHCLTRAIKDLFPRYRTMRGYRCERKAGWDTHGLPVEVEVCKELGIHSKEEIEAHGIEPFIHKCQQSVWRYMQEWTRLTERLGFWIHLDEAYVTYHQSYVESVWWSLKQLFDRGLLYQGHKIVWWWAQGGTALSAGEVGQGYREVADPSVYVKFPLLIDEGPFNGASLLVWTTTPWTLPSNQFVAIHPKLKYSVIHEPGTAERLIVATQLVASLQEKTKKQFEVERTEYLGQHFVGCRYEPPFECFTRDIKHFGTIVAPGSIGAENYIRSFLNEFLTGGPCKDLLAFKVVGADFVTTDSGTGLVHLAPAFGEDDFGVLLEQQAVFDRTMSGHSPRIRPELINAVATNGTFTDEAPEYCRGRWVKDCDKDIIRDLKERGLLFHREQYVHDYPFCWRAEEDPLIQYPRESWFIRTTAFKEEMLKNNAQINWLPEHIKDGRFGKFLESNVDWALSRERYWGTPLPIWKCDETGQMEAVGSYAELREKPGFTGDQVWFAAKQKNPELPDDLCVHKPYIDEMTYDSPFAQGAKMRRVPEVIDCWYDSGAMPFAQWGYPNAPGSAERFESQFPADFISEALDQTRGWFYSQLAISTLLFGERKAESGKPNADSNTPLSAFRSPLSDYPHPFRNCIVLGLMLGEDGQKMSKSKRNYRTPDEIFDLYGADALRWYFFANQPPWTSIRYSEQAIRDSVPEFLLRLWNVYSFFTIYANIDGFDPGKEVGGQGSEIRDLDSEAFITAKSYRPVKERSELDRWILGELHGTCRTVVERMDEYDNYAACQTIIAFVDALSNWYVRRSRDRFWAADKRLPEKLDAYWTLYECLLTTAKLIAPFVPFLAENLWQSLAAAVFGGRVHESVHLCDYPTGDAVAIDEALSARMNLVREISSLGRQARTSCELKVRQPLAKVEVILADRAHQPWLESHAALIAEELNVKSVEFAADAQQYVDYSILPNFKRLGPKLGKNMPKVKKLLAEADGGQLLTELKSAGAVRIAVNGDSVELDEEDLEFRLQAKSGWTAAQGRGVVVVLATELTDALVSEGLARDLVRAIQDLRKEKDCEFTDRIEVGVVTESPDVRRAVELFRDYIMQETLATELHAKPLQSRSANATKIGDADVQLYLQVAS